MSTRPSPEAALPPPGARTPSAREQQLLGMLSLAERMPIIFANGFEISQFQGLCSRCGSVVPMSDTRGSVTFPTPHLAVLEVVAVCRPCRFGTPLLLRMRDTGEFTTLLGHRWQAGRVQSSWWARVRRWLGRHRAAR